MFTADIRLTNHQLTEPQLSLADLIHRQAAD